MRRINENIVKELMFKTAILKFKGPFTMADVYYIVINELQINWTRAEINKRFDELCESGLIVSTELGNGVNAFLVSEERKKER